MEYFITSNMDIIYYAFLYLKKLGEVKDLPEVT